MAIYEQDVVMFETKKNGDKVIKMPISRVNNIEGIGRSISTAYAVGDIIYVDNNKKVALKCTTAGTTSSSELNVSTASIGKVITDGTVKWQVCNRTSDVTSVNGKTGDVVVDVGVTSVNGGSGAVTLKESPSDMTDYIIESYRNGTEWYEVYKSGKVEQGGIATATGGEINVTFLKAFIDKNYTLVSFPAEGYFNNDFCLVGITGTGRTSTSFQLTWDGNRSDPSEIAWRACGKGA